jgi:hypothetical protein
VPAKRANHMRMKERCRVKSKKVCGAIGTGA